ncbi:MAG TPA: ATP-binding protein [Chthoniobacterales bacterium]|nr:ATP-binding protein [Chthoniobacterales bacterium]
MTDIPERERTSGPPASSNASSDERASILLVDDRTDKLLALETVLACLGQNLVLAHSGTEALRLILQNDFALIVLDVSMPEMDGFETAALIRQRPRCELTPIIFVSAVNYSDTHLSRGYSLGAVDYILAPIVPEILRAKVSFFIEFHKKNQLLKRQAELETELIRAQAAREQAEAANNAKDRVLAMLSHELRTPLTPILLASSILSEMPSVPDEIRNELRTIARNVELEARLIDDLLDATQLSLGKCSLMLEMVDVNILVHSVLKICAQEIAAKRLTVQCDLVATENTIRADPARLQQVFWNVIKNAIKFTPLNGRITVHSSNLQKGQLRLQVIDSGIGIAASALPKIFDPFEQAGQNGLGGLGLGLAISRGIIELHGGQISALSPGAGHGATFVIELPTLNHE